MTNQPIIRVTAHDLELGDQDTVELKPGQYVVVCANPIYVAHEQCHQNGTVVVTLKRRVPAEHAEPRTAARIRRLAAESTEKA